MHFDTFKVSLFSIALYKASSNVQFTTLHDVRIHLPELKRRIPSKSAVKACQTSF